MYGKNSHLFGNNFKIIHLVVTILTFLGGIRGQPDSAKNVNKDGCLCLEEIANKLRLPVSLVNANDGSNRIFVAEQYGAVNVLYPNGTKLAEPLIDISSRIGGLAKVSEEGVGDIAFHPNFASNGLFYMLFSTPEKKKGVDHYSNLGEFKISAKDANKADPDYFRLLLKFPEQGWAHNAERLLFGIDNYLYIFTGDGGSKPDKPSNVAQKMIKYNGKVLRIDVGPHTGDDPYWIPADNPFQEPLADGTKALPEIYAVGFRNPWRCGVDQGDRLTGYGRGRIFCGDVGQHSVEELNSIEKGGNYGWNVDEGGKPMCKKCKYAPIEGQTMVNPIFSYNHEAKLGSAVIGGEFYRGCLYPQLNGLYIWGDHYAGLLHRLYENAAGDWEHSEIELCDTSVCKAPLTDDYASKIISFGRDENGEVYLLAVSNADPSKKAGHVYRFVDPVTQKDPGLCETEFQERVAAIRNSNTQYNGQGSLLDMDAFNNAKPQEDPLQESADDTNEDVFLSFPGITSPKESTAGAQPPSSSVDGAPLTSIKDTEPSASEENPPKIQSILSNLPTGLSKKQQYFSYLQQLQKLSVERGKLQIEQEGASESSQTDTFSEASKSSLQTELSEIFASELKPVTENEEKTLVPAADIPKQTDQTSVEELPTDEQEDSNFEELMAEMISNPFLSSVFDNFLVLTEQKESAIPGGEEQLSDAAMDQLIDEILDKPTMMGGVISTLFGNLNVDSTPSASDADTEPSNKPSTQDTADGTDALVQLIDNLLAESDIGSISALLENSDEEEKLTTIDSILPSESHADTKQSSEPNTDDKVEDAESDNNEDELIDFKQAHSATLIEEFLDNPSAETLVEVLMDQPGIQAIITGLTDSTDTEKLEAFLLEGPNAANIISEVINEPQAEKSIKVIFKDPKTIALIREQIFGDMDELEEQTKTGEETEFADEDIDTLIERLIKEPKPVESIVQILSQDDPLDLVAELLVDPQTEGIIKDLLTGHLSVDFVDSLLVGLTPEEVMIALEDDSPFEGLFKYLLQTKTSQNSVKILLENVFRSGISHLVDPSGQIPTENQEYLNGEPDIANIVALLKNNANYMKLVDAILEKSNVAKVIVELLNDETVGEKMANFLNSRYTRRRIGTYLLMGSNARKEMSVILSTPGGNKLFTFLLRSPTLGTNTAMLIKAMYSAKLATYSAAGTNEEALLANQLDMLTELKKIAVLLADHRAEELIVDLTRAQASAEKTHIKNAKKQAILQQTQQAPSSPTDEPTPIIPGSQPTGSKSSASFQTPRTFDHVFRWHRTQGRVRLFNN